MKILFSKEYIGIRAKFEDITQNADYEYKSKNIL